MKTGIRLLIVLVLCAAVFGGVFGMKYMSAKGMQSFFDNMPVPPATISTALVERQSWPRRLQAIGTLAPVNGVDVTAESSGVIRELRFESGGHVEKGAVLVTLDSDTDRAELKTLETQAALAKSDLQRLKKLIDLQSISQAQYDQAESRYREAQARVQAQRTRLAKKTVRAPFAGKLGIRKVNVGQYVEPGKPIVSLQAIDTLYADFKLPEQHVSQVSTGGKVIVTADLYPDESYQGVVQAIEPTVEEKTRNFLVRAALPNADGKLKPGVFARVELLLPGDNDVLIVPRTAISYNPYGNSVFVITEKGDGSASGAEGKPQLVARQKFVQTGEGRGDYVVVTSGLEAGEQIATSGLLKLRNDQPVIINNELAPQVSTDPSPADS